MTFTGCWTCKRRKVKCDERPQRCTNCERMGIACDGYGVKLQWMTDPFAEPRRSQGQIRGRIRIGMAQTIESRAQRCPTLTDSVAGRDSGAVYSMEAIDAFLSALERDVGSSRGRPSQRGPFAVFLGIGKGGFSGTAAVSSTPDASDAYRQRPMRQRPHEAREAESLAARADVENVVREETDLNRNTRRLDRVDGRVRLRHSANVSAACSAETTIPGSVFASVSADTTVNRLMHHYVIHVAGLLQPIDHPQNPYRTLYVPAALTAASGPSAEVQASADPNATVHSVLLHSLMSSASFHLWNCSPAHADYHKLGAQHRREALRLLNAALELHASAIDYKTLMMAMLSLVSIDVCAPFYFHNDELGLTVTV